MKTNRFLFGVLLLLTSVIVIGCEESMPPADSPEAVQERQALYIQTRELRDFPKEINITKTGILEGTSSINVNAQASGIVKQIHFQDGDQIQSGQTFLRLSDDVASYSLSVQAARNALDATRLNYEYTKLLLEKTITDAQIAYKKAVGDLDNIRSISEEQVLQAQRTYDSVRGEESINKAALDLETLKKSHTETLTGFDRTLQNEYTKLRIFLSSAIDQMDQLLGVTYLYKYENDLYEEFLGARNVAIKNHSIQKLKTLIREKEILESSPLSGSLEEKITKLLGVYALAEEALNSMEDTLMNTIESKDFTASQIASKRTIIDGLQGSQQANVSVLLSFFNTAMSFLGTYETDFGAKQAAFDLMVSQHETSSGNAQSSIVQTTSSASQQVRASEVLVETTRNNLTNAQDMKVIQMKQLENQIASAQISVAQASTQASKLNLTSPINGVVGSVLVDVGQEVHPGTPAFSLSSTHSVFSIFVDINTVSSLAPGQKIEVTYRGSPSLGTIVSVSSIADAGLNYEVKIEAGVPAEFLGDFVEARIPVVSSYAVIPLEHVLVVSPSQGKVWTYNTTEAIQKNVILGNIWGDVVEIVSGLEPEDIIIITNMSAYNDVDYVLEYAPQES